MSKKTKGCALGLALGGVIRASVFIVGKLLSGIAWVLAYFGLWIPFLYALGGVALFLVYNFNPFEPTNPDSVLYLVGFGLCMLASLIWTVRKLIYKPIKKLFKKDETAGDENGSEPPAKRHWYDKKAKRPVLSFVSSGTQTATMLNSDAEFVSTGRLPPESQSSHLAGAISKPAECDEYASYRARREAGFIPGEAISLSDDERILSRGAVKDEKPKIYFSNLEPDTLVHEYSNRFEVFKVVGDRKYFVNVEYKDDFQ